jgi:ribosomal protein S18 acetylase RimI-like enzyme
LNTVIRELNDDDCIELLPLINNELGYPNVTIDGLLSRFTKMKKAGNYYIYVAVTDGQVVGFIAAIQEISLEIQNDYFRIINLAVSETFQGKGIGKALLQHIEDISFSKGITFIVLSCGFHRLEAHEFYQRNGYVKRSFTFAKGDK